MEVSKKLSVLKKVAILLNKNNIIWAVGASLLLYFKGITDNFQDIDIMVHEDDAAKAEALLTVIGALQPKIQNTQYKTKVFLEYVIDGVELDVMAGFTIVSNSAEHYFPLQKEDIKESMVLDGIAIPLQSVEVWKMYYALMGREDKVRMIRRKEVCNLKRLVSLVLVFGLCITAAGCKRSDSFLEPESIAADEAAGDVVEQPESEAADASSSASEKDSAYEILSGYSEGLAAAKSGEKLFYVDENGNIVIELDETVTAAGSFKGGLARLTVWPTEEEWEYVLFFQGRIYISQIY